MTETTHERRRTVAWIGWCATVGSVALLAAVGCADSGKSGAEDTTRSCGGLVPDTTPLRRMTDTQFANTVHDLLGEQIAVADFPASQPAEGNFSTDAAANVVSDIGVSSIFYAVEDVARQASATQLDALLPCAPAQVDADCVRTFVADFGERAYRRPLSERELSTLEAAWNDQPADADTTERMEVVLSVMLFSPQFLYITQGGGEPVDRTAPDGSALVRLSDWEIASRLSFALWDSMPDEELFAAARAGELHTKDQVREQARRLLGDPRAEPVIARFHVEWLGVEHLPNLAKSEVAHPGWSSELASDMVEETERYVVAVTRGGGRFADLIGGEGARETVLNDRLAAHYGVPGGGGPDDWAPASYPEQRAGVLTQAAFLAAHADTVDPNPVKRGAYIQRRILCDQIPAPPPDIPALPDTPSGKTKRDVLAAHRANAACATCHDRIDPSGLALETFDAIGAWRTRENGVDIDPAGTFPELEGEALGDFSDARQMVDLLSTSELAHGCYAQNWFHYVTGEQVTAEEACVNEAVGSNFVGADGDVEDLLLDLVSMPSFLHRRAPEEN